MGAAFFLDDSQHGVSTFADEIIVVVGVIILISGVLLAAEEDNKDNVAEPSENLQ